MNFKNLFLICAFVLSTTGLMAQSNQAQRIRVMNEKNSECLDSHLGGQHDGLQYSKAQIDAAYEACGIDKGQMKIDKKAKNYRKKNYPNDRESMPSESPSSSSPYPNPETMTE